VLPTVGGMIRAAARRSYFCLLCMSLALTLAGVSGCSRTPPASGPQIKPNQAAEATNDGGKGAVELDDRLIGEWEHVFKKDEKYPAGDLFPSGTKSVIRFGGDGTSTAMTFSPDGTEYRVERRWRVEYTFPNTKESFLVWRTEIGNSPEAGSGISDVVQIIDNDTITIQSPVDLQPFEYQKSR